MILTKQSYPLGLSKPMIDQDTPLSYVLIVTDQLVRTYRHGSVMHTTRQPQNFILWLSPKVLIEWSAL